MSKGYHHVAREQRSQISALKAIATMLHRHVLNCNSEGYLKINMAYADIRQSQIITRDSLIYNFLKTTFDYIQLSNKGGERCWFD